MSSAWLTVLLACAQPLAAQTADSAATAPSATKGCSEEHAAAPPPPDVSPEDVSEEAAVGLTPKGPGESSVREPNGEPPSLEESRTEELRVEESRVEEPSVEEPSVEEPAHETRPVRYHWLDRTREVLYDTMWHSAAHVDRWFGSAQQDTVYQQIYGSLAPAVLYSPYYGFRQQLRFNMNFPLPEINDRLHAFVGRFDPNEFITERDEPSGAFARNFGPQTEDQTLFGIGYHEPSKQGGRFDLGAGIRLALPMDPYIKGSYVYERGRSETGLFSVRETLFWQHSDGAGETTRLDMERILKMQWLLRYTVSGTRSQDSQGLRGYSSILVLRGLPSRRAIAFDVGFDGQTEAPVPLHDYGIKMAYRQGILRRWLIMELRGSLDWPKDFTYQHRTANPGIGLGFEMLIGTDEFLARPVTF